MSAKKLTRMAALAGVGAILGAGALSLFAAANAYTVMDSDRTPGSYICLNNPNPKCQ